MTLRFASDGISLTGYLARPRGRSASAPGLVICSGFPPREAGTPSDVWLLPELADRIAREMGWFTLTFAFRGCGDSEGDFSLRGWIDDIVAASAFLRDQGAAGVWLAGFGTGGSLALCAAAEDPDVRGVATLGAPADFDDWARNPKRLLEHSRELGLVRSAGFPPSIDAWSKEVRATSPLGAVTDYVPRPLLVLHGSDDDLVPVFDARVLWDAHGAAELRIIDGAGHQLRYDPRAIAVLLGWLDRQRRLN